MNSKAKGNRGQLELLHILHENDVDAIRNQQGGVGGMSNPDIAAVYHGYPVHVQVKRVQRLNIHAAMQQAVRDCGERIPVVAHRMNGEQWLVTMRLLDLL